jgi:hypothetical protein
MLPHESRKSKRSKSAVAGTTNQLLSTEVVEDGIEDITPVRGCVLNPIQPQLTEESLLQLEQSLPGYRLAQRNLHHWFYYIESTFQDSFDTYRDYPDRDYYPSCFNSPVSETPLSQADFQESHHSPVGSTDLFGNTVRLAQDIQVVIPACASTSGLPHPQSSGFFSSSIESSFGPSSPVVDYPPESPRPASTLAPAELSHSELQQPLDTRQSRSRSRPRSLTPSNSSYHPELRSPLSIRRRITRSRSQHIRRKLPKASDEVISLLDSEDD